jgi:pyruvate formate lyase activating enzyme
MEEEGIVFNIQRFSINDGPGIRTCVFLKGCPLDCLWCHNPESKSFKPELSFTESKCTGCRKCIKICPNKCHEIINRQHIIHRNKCTACGRCVQECCGALSIYGKRVTAEDVLKILVKDRPFYKRSGGGVTFTGGEPFAQPEFLLSMLKKSKEEDLHVCVETSGYVKREILEKALNYIDIFLYDCKETNEELHKKYTGTGRDLILQNLQYIAGKRKTIILRCPVIPGYNDRRSHFKAIGELANKYEMITEIDIEPYHPLGKTKAESIGREYSIAEDGITPKETIVNWITEIKSYTTCPVIRG